MELRDQSLPVSILPNRPIHFIGRENIINEMSKAYQNSKQIIILCSYAGTGKTTIANEFGHMFTKKKKGNYAFWMKSDERNLDTEFENFAVDLGIVDKQPSRKAMIKRVFSKITQFDSQHKILFIFDNCDNYEDIENYLTFIPENVFILITTRDFTMVNNLNDKNTKQFFLEPFEEHDCIEYLKKNFGDSADYQDLKSLLDLIDISSGKIRPYVLNRLTAFVKIKTELKSLKTFINECKSSESNNIIKMIIKQDKIFEILVLKETKAWDILKYSSCLDPDFIPFEIFTNILNVNHDDMINSVNVLRKISFIIIENKGDERGLKIHRNLQEEIQQYLNIKDFNEFNTTIRVLIEMLRKFLNTNFDEIRKKGYNKQVYLYNFKKLLAKCIKDMKLSNDLKKELLNKFGAYNFNIGKYKDALVYYQQSLDINDPDSVLDGHVFYNIGVIYRFQGNFEKSLQYLLDSLAVFRKSFQNDENQSITNTFRNIGIAYTFQGDYLKAHENLQFSLDLNRKLFKDDNNSNAADTLNYIGLAYRYQGKYKEANENFYKSLFIKRNIYKSDDSLSIADTLNNIASLYLFQCKFKESLEHYQKSLASYRKMFENDENFFIAVVLTNMGSVYCRLSQYDESIKCCIKALEIYDKVNGNTNNLKIPDTYSHACLSYIKKGQVKEGLKYGLKSLELFRNFFKDDDNFRTAEVINNIGLGYFYSKEYDKAEKFVEQSIQIYEKVLPNCSDIRLAEAFFNRALICEHFKDCEKASEYYEKSLEISRSLIQDVSLI